MRVFIAVLVDLFDFLCSLVPIFKSKPNPKISQVPLIAPRVDPVLLSVLTPLSALAAPQKNPLLTENVLTTQGSNAYVITAVAEVQQRPLWAFDSVYTRFLYGTPVTVLGYEGRFARIIYQTSTAWILKDQLSVKASDAIPTLITGNIYLAADAETKKLRSFIKDDFFTAELYLPLQGVEYVTYCLQKSGLAVNWSAARPRPAGVWHQLLKGRSGVTIKVTPKTGSVLEYQTEAGVGVVGYVEAVTPDETITLASVGRNIEGQFLVEVLTKDVWQSLGPVWLQIQ